MKTAKKSAVLIFRVEKKLRAQFLAAVEAKGENSSEVLRRAMREYVDGQSGSQLRQPIQIRVVS